MQATTFIAALFFGLAAAHPSPAEAVAKAESAVGVRTRQWEAHGGCERKYKDQKTCNSTCITEADHLFKCPGWSKVTGANGGSCWWGRSKCSCYCELH